MQFSEKALQDLVDYCDNYSAVFYDRQMGEVVWEINEDYFEAGAVSEEEDRVSRANLEKYHRETDRYVHVHQIQSRDSYRVMARFVAQLPEDKYEYKMEAALEGRKPFRNFKDQVDDSPYREDWFKFRDAEMRAAYAEQLRWALEEE